MMKQTERVQLKAVLPDPKGPAVLELATEFVVTGPYLGDADNKFATREPFKVTKKNIAVLAGQKPTITGIEPIESVSIETGEDGQDTKTLAFKTSAVGKNGTLIFSTAPENWPAEIAAQDEELRTLNRLLEALNEAKRDPTKRRDLAVWLAQTPDGQKAFDAIRKKPATNRP
jgi:hypothetical protein